MISYNYIFVSSNFLKPLDVLKSYFKNSHYENIIKGSQ